MLFISISATVTPASLRHLILPTLALIAILVLITRPLVAFLATLRTDMTAGERAFTGWMAPRGIVAAATASTFSATLVAQHIGGASKILPVTFIVIVVTVALYGLTAVPAARLARVTRPAKTRPLLVGGEDWVVDLGCALRTLGLEVLMWAGFDEQRERIKAGLELAPGELLASATGRGAHLEGITAVLLLTGEDDFNALGSTVLSGGVDGPVYRLAARLPSHGVVAPYTGGEVLFDPRLTRYEVGRRYAGGARIHTRPANGGAPADGSLLFLVRVDGRLAPVTVERPAAARAGRHHGAALPGRRRSVMLHVRVVSPAALTRPLTDRLTAAPGVHNVVVRAGAARRPDGDAVQFDVRDAAANPVFTALRELGLDRDAVICVERVDATLTGQSPAGGRRGALRQETAPVWEMVEAVIRDGETYAPSFYILLAIAALIGAVGILTNSQILIVGAMVVGPEYNAIIGVALGITRRARSEIRDGLLALCWGFLAAIVLTLLFGLAVRASGKTPAPFLKGVRPVADLINAPNIFSVIVAVLAGLVGVVSLTEARANALIGVFISVTTIPAAASRACRSRTRAGARHAGQRSSSCSTSSCSSWSARPGCAPSTRSGDHLPRVIRRGSAGSEDGGVTEHYDAIIVGSGAGGGANAIRVGEHLLSRMS